MKEKLDADPNGTSYADGKGRRTFVCLVFPGGTFRFVVRKKAMSRKTAVKQSASDKQAAGFPRSREGERKEAKMIAECGL